MYGCVCMYLCMWPGGWGVVYLGTGREESISRSLGGKDMEVLGFSIGQEVELRRLLSQQLQRCKPLKGL